MVVECKEVEEDMVEVDVEDDDEEEEVVVLVEKNEEEEEEVEFDPELRELLLVDLIVGRY
jgi:hypothetical protein